MKGSWLASTFCLLAAVGVARGDGEIRHADVFVSGTDGYHSYRIPAIETAPDGSLVALCEARKHNLADPGFGKQDIDQTACVLWERGVERGYQFITFTAFDVGFVERGR